MDIILFLLVLALLIFAHEFGHFIVAKKSGIKVEEFGLGFPPRIFKFKKGETIYSINLLPLGGFVKIYGEEGEGVDDPRSFSSKPISTRAAVIVAGVVFNFFLAYLLLVLAFTTGIPAGFLADYFGEEIIKFSLIISFVKAFQSLGNITYFTFEAIIKFISDLFTGVSSLDNLMGPVGIMSVTSEAAKIGFGYLLSFIALISINLAIINILPFPALDGGRLIFLLVEKIKGSPVSPKIVNVVNFLGFALLIFLMIIVTYRDIIRFF